jgi:NADPH-dependent 2,4-dienoyl-CoA reductase/sulfur reductase-like enzyme
MPLKWSTMTDPAPRNDFVSFPAPTEAILVALFIGLEMAEAFCARGLEVTVVEQAPAIMPTVDVELGRLLGEELRRHGVKLVNEVTVKAIHHDAGGLTVAGEPDFAATADLVLVVVGVRPDTQLAVAAGVQTGVRGAIRVDRHMRTNLPDILAAGDCVETWHRLLEAPTYLPLGTTAHKQGRIAGETAVGGDRTFAGSLGTQVVKVFELAVARTGLRDPDARQAGFDAVTVGSSSTTRPTARVATSSTSVLPVIGEAAGCWVLSWSATRTPRSPSASISPPTLCSTT